MKQTFSLASQTSGAFVGVDVGGTKVAVLVAKDGEEIARAVSRTRLDTPENTLVGIADTIQEAVSLTQIRLADVNAIGLGFPGRVDPLRGNVQLAVNLNLRDMEIGPLLEEMLGVPCFLENDVRMATLGLKFHPDFSQVDNLAYLSIGTGIAAGIILNGELHRGINGMAGEIGHIEVTPDGPLCQCGARGCLETVAAGPAIEKMMLLAQHPISTNSGVSVPLVTAGTIFQMATHGDPIAKDIATQVSRYLGWAVKLLVLSYDVELVIFGGGVSRAGNAFLDSIVQDLRKRQRESDLAREMLRPEIIKMLPLDFDAALWGGIALAQRGLIWEKT